MALRIWHAVPMPRPENLLPSFSPGSDTKVLTSPKSCPFSTVLTARLPAVTEAAKTCHFHSDVVCMEEEAKTLQVEVSARVESLVCAREQVDFFLLRKQPHSDSLVCSCEARELACDRSPRQPLERAGQQTVGSLYLRARPQEGSPTELVIEQKLGTGFQGKSVPKMGAWLNKLSFHFRTIYSSDGTW